jgi:hypothetical protein
VMSIYFYVCIRLMFNSHYSPITVSCLLITAYCYPFGAEGGI